MLESDKVATRVLDPTKYDEVVTSKGCEVIDAFLSKIIHEHMKAAFTSVRLNVMNHALCVGEGPLPPGLMIQNAYSEMHNGSKMLTLWWKKYGIPSDPEEEGKLSGKSGGCQPNEWAAGVAWHDRCAGWGPKHPDIKTDHRAETERLFEKLDLSSLESWSPGLADSAHSLLTEYHDLFSLEPCELGCTYSTEHVIKGHWWRPI